MEDENRSEKRFDLVEGALPAKVPLAVDGKEDDGAAEVSLEELVLNRRCIADGSHEAGPGVLVVVRLEGDGKKKTLEPSRCPRTVGDDNDALMSRRAILLVR